VSFFIPKKLETLPKNEFVLLVLKQILYTKIQDVDVEMKVLPLNIIHTPVCSLDENMYGYKNL